MFDVLLESRRVRPPRPFVATVVSAVLHTGLVVAVAGGTAAVAASDSLDPYFDKLARMILPPNVPPTVGGEKTTFVAIAEEGSPKGEVVGARERVEENKFLGEAVVPRRIAQTVEMDGAMQLAAAAQSFGAFTIFELDSIAERDPLSAAPAYPKDLLDKNIEGSATLRFVIDSTGLVDLATILVVNATHQEFAQAVREAMPRMRFRPAMRGSFAVRQLVEQPYKFEIAKSSTAVRVIRPL